MRFGLQTPLCNLCREVYNETKAEGFLSVFAVALLAEGVDRNRSLMLTSAILYVALLAEGVDRNIYYFFMRNIYIRSPSSRRAWIEIYFIS